MMEIIIKQLENQIINIENNNLQQIDINETKNQEIKLNNTKPQELKIKENENQIINIEETGSAAGVTDVVVNGVSVVSGGIAYVITPTKTSELINNSGFITHEEDPTVASYIKAITQADINNWNNKQDELVSGSNIKTINNTSLLGNGNINIDGTIYTAGTGININNSNVISNTIVSYDDLQDTPEIPTATSQLQNDSDYVSSNELADVAFSGSYVDLSETPEIPDSTSELINDSGFIDKNVNDLTYYTATSNLGAVAVSNDYIDLNNKPTIPTKTSELQNDSNFIDNTVNNLTNYTNNTNLSTLLNNKENKSIIGSNTDGTYIKFDNDYMICYGTVNLNNLAITGSFEGVYYANTGNITYPETFTTTPNVIISPLNIAGGGFSFYGVNTSSFNGFIWKTASATKSIVFYYLAIGKWR